MTTAVSPEPSAPQQDTSPAFYVTGGTLGAAAASYVERQADYDLLGGLTGGDYCYVLNSRQMGKSSLCVRTMARLRELGGRTCFLDLTKFGGKNLSAEQWYAALLSEAGRELGLRAEMLAYWKANTELGPMQRFFGAMQQVALPATESPMTVFVDEIDVTRGLPFSADEFFAGVRQCYVGRATDAALSRLTICLLGTATPADLIQDTRTSPFNIGRRIEVCDFTPVEAAPLAQGLGSNGPALLSRVLHWTGGHPYLTQRLCRAAQESGAKTPADIDKLCSGLFLTRSAAETDDNLAFVRNRLLKSEVDLAGLLDLYGQMRRGRRVPDDEADQQCAVLKLSGVARSEGGRLRVRNRIYQHVFSREWIVEHTPGAELRRQREAYRRGLMRAGAVAACVVMVMGLLALSSIQYAGRASANAKAAKENAAEAKANAWTAHTQETLAGRRELQAVQNASDARQQRIIAEQQQQIAQGAAADARRQRKIALSSLSVAKTQTRRADAKTQEAISIATRLQLALNEAQAEKFRAESSLYVADMNTIQEAWRVSDAGRALDLLKETRDLPGRGFEWGYWNSVLHPKMIILSNQAKFGLRFAAFSPDGRRIITGGSDGKTHIWDTQTERQLLTLKGHRIGRYVGFFSPDGSRILTNDDLPVPDGIAHVWDTLTGRDLLTLHPEGGVSTAAFSPDGKTLLTGGGSTTHLWDAHTGRELFTLPIGEATTASAFSLDGTRIVTGSVDGTVCVWDVKDGRKLASFPGGTEMITVVAFSPDDTRLVTDEWHDAGTARVWDAQTGRELFALVGHTSPVTCAAFSPDGTRIVTGSADRSARVWDAKDGRELLTFIGHTRDVQSVAFSPDGTQVLTASRDGTARIWDTRIEHGQIALTGYTVQVTCVAFSPDGTRIITGNADRTARIWDAKDGRELLRLHTGGHVWSAAYSFDGTRILTSGAATHLWDAQTGHDLLTLPGSTCAAFSPDGTRILTGNGDQRVRVWNAKNGRKLLTLDTRGQGNGKHAAFSPDGARIVTDEWDEMPHVWDARTGRTLLTLAGNTKASYPATFSPDGTRIIAACIDDTVQVWDARTGRVLFKLHTGAAITAAFSPDGTRIVTGNTDGAAQIWDAKDGRELLTLPRERGWIISAAFSPDGTRLVIGTDAIDTDDRTANRTAAHVWETDFKDYH